MSEFHAPPRMNRDDGYGYAYLTITGAGSAQVITDRLGVKPSESWSQGDARINHRTGEPRLKPDGSALPPYDFMRWSLASSLSNDEPAEAHVQKLLVDIEPVADALRDLPSAYRRTICVVGYAHQSFGFILPCDTASHLASMGLELEFDIYPQGDVRDIITELIEDLQLGRTA